MIASPSLFAPASSTRRTAMTETHPPVTVAQPINERGWLTTKEAAWFLRASPRTLERWRVTGEGPKFHKAGRGLRSRVLYRESELVAWLDGLKFVSTSEYATQASRR